jgi:hypothetical protein
MAKLSGTTTALDPTTRKKGGDSILQAKKKKTTKTHGGQVVPELKAKTELFLTGVATFAGEGNYYESGEDRIKRVRELVAKVTKKDPEWVANFVSWLRGPDANIRTLSIIIAAEYVMAGGPDGANVIDSVCQRADEPAEFLAYWMQRNYGWEANTFPLPSPRLPQAVRKGLSRAAIRLYDEYSVMKYDGNSRGVGMASVINLVHPRVKDYPAHWTQDQVDNKRAVFAYIIAKDYGNEPDVSHLMKVRSQIALRGADRERILSLTTDDMRNAGLTWESLGGLLQGPWTASAWETVIPTMGYMALLRNLRNFEEIGISDDAVEAVCKRLADPEQVAKSRQMPFRFLNAYDAVRGSDYLKAIEKALDHSINNVPAFEGRTLVLVDKSGSMDRYGFGYGWGDERGQNVAHPSLCPWKIGAVFATALWRKGEAVDVGVFGDRSKLVDIPKGTSVLRGINALNHNHGVGHGTNIWGSVASQYNGHDRVIVFTDMQDNHGYGMGSHAIKKNVPFIHFFDVGGYGKGSPTSKGDTEWHYGGFTDATFRLMPLLEAGASASWPF